MSVQVTGPQLATLRSKLLDLDGATPLHERFRALFMLKAVGGPKIIGIISEGRSPPSLSTMDGLMGSFMLFIAT